MQYIRLIMTNIKTKSQDLLIKLQEFVLSYETKKRIPLIKKYLDANPGDILLDVGGNTGNTTQYFSQNCNVFVLEPDHKAVQYGKRNRPDIKFIEGFAENIPLPDKYFDKVLASASFHHFSDQDKALEELKRVLKPAGKIVIMEFDPKRTRGKIIKTIESLLHMGSYFYEPHQLRKKVQDHGLKVLSVESTTSSGYFLIANNNT
jgi:ubiquinone/menaquinone biosynthesis C-methylase UbiE